MSNCPGQLGWSAGWVRCPGLHWLAWAWAVRLGQPLGPLGLARHPPGSVRLATTVSLCPSLAWAGWAGPGFTIVIGSLTVNYWVIGLPSLSVHQLVRLGQLGQ